MSRITALWKKKEYHRTKKKKDKKPTPSHQLKKLRRYPVSCSKENKTHRKRCNATITRVLNTSGTNYKINLTRESEFS